MSNRTDFETLARELASDDVGEDPLHAKRIERELHNAFVAGQEAEESKRVTELQTKNTELENARRMWRARANHARAMLIDVLIDAPTVARMCAGDPHLATSLEAVMQGSAMLFNRIEQLEADAWTRAHACAREFIEASEDPRFEIDMLSFINTWREKFKAAIKPVE